MAQVNYNEPSRGDGGDGNAGVYAILIIVVLLILGAVLYFAGAFGPARYAEEGTDIEADIRLEQPAETPDIEVPDVDVDAPDIDVPDTVRIVD